VKHHPLPSTERRLLGPGPSPVSDRVREALAAPPRSHLDAEFVLLLDDVRTGLTKLFQAPPDHLTLALSGTGSTGMDAAAVNLVEPGMMALCVINGFFGERLAQTFSTQGAFVERLDGEWGRAIDPEAVRLAMQDGKFDVVSIVHGETSTGVMNPVDDIAPIVRGHGALLVVDAVTSLGAVPVDVAAWGADVCYSCSQKGIGAPSGLAPISVSSRAREQLIANRQFSLDLQRLEDYWLRRRYHHTISAPMIYALHTALAEVHEEGLTARWARHREVHRALVDRLQSIGLELLPPPADRLASLNAVQVPPGVDEAAVRHALLADHHIEIGAGLGPLAGRIWRIGLMGSGATLQNVDRLVEALSSALQYQPNAR